MTFQYDSGLSTSTTRRYGLSIGPSLSAQPPSVSPTLIPTESLSLKGTLTVGLSLDNCFVHHSFRSIRCQPTIVYQDQHAWISQLSELYSQHMVKADGIVSLTKRDQTIIETLLLRVRCLSLKQVARTWWSNTSNPDQNARRRLQRLAQAGLVKSFTAVAHPEIPLNKPIFRWAPNHTEPDFTALAYHLDRRWPADYRPTPAVIASEHASRLFGGSGGRFPRSSEETHDIHLAAVYLHHATTAPDLANTWTHEDNTKPSPGEKVPDAFIQKAGHRIAVEFAGKYTKDKLQEFHEYCNSRSMPYELW